MLTYGIFTGSSKLTASPLLLKLGIPLKLCGHKYICSAVNVYYSLTQTKSSIGITRDVYPEVARQYNTTPQNVEKSIRHAVEICFLHGDINLIHKLFGNTINEVKGKATNSEFITAITYWLAREAEEE